VLVLRTDPPFAAGNPFPIVSGTEPLTVSFSVRRSSDPDQDPERPGEGDTLNWQFHFGDSGTAAFNDDGAFNADIGHVCHVEHTYQYAGSYVATVSVTDQHLEDQAHEVAALARDTCS